VRKRLELTDPASCLSKAADDEIVFVLRGHDQCAPDTIREWVRLRTAAGKNRYDDAQINEALDCAEQMERERATPPPRAPEAPRP